jgi:hypothetical protein
MSGHEQDLTNGYPTVVDDLYHALGHAINVCGLVALKDKGKVIMHKNWMAHSPPVDFHAPLMKTHKANFSQSKVIG